MKIQNNISALNAFNYTKTNQTVLTKTLEKLSSGYKINRAGDDAAGLAISEKMRGQIRGLNMANKNAQDGISLIQVAEGALNETHAMLQRIRELSVQAANDTNTSEDRKHLQKEVDQLLLEIDGIANNTEFNTKKLLNGTHLTGNMPLFLQIGANQAQHMKLQLNGDATTNGLGIAGKMVEVTDAQGFFQSGILLSMVTPPTGRNPHNQATTNSEDYFSYDESTQTLSFNKKNDATQTYPLEFTRGNIDDATSFTNKTFSFNNVSKNTFLELQARFPNNTNLTWPDVPVSNDLVSLVTRMNQAFKGAFGERNELQLDYSKGITDNYIKIDIYETLNFTVEGKYDEAQQAYVFQDNKGYAPIIVSSQKMTTLMTENERNSIFTSINNSLRDVGGKFHFRSHAFTYKMDEKSEKEAYTLPPFWEFQQKIDLSTHEKANKSISNVDSALAIVSDMRSQLGSYQNRLEHTINNLSNTAENLTAAESRIRDTDIAKEMMAFTKQNILLQASQSMLSQANQHPQQILKLLA